MLSDEHRQKLLTCLWRCRNNPDVFGQYTGALNSCDHEEKRDEIMEKILYPFQYRIQRKLQQIQDYTIKVCSEATDRFDFLTYEQLLDDVIKKIPVQPAEKRKSIVEQIEEALKAKEGLHMDSTEPE
jgi:hypothetical protein